MMAVVSIGMAGICTFWALPIDKPAKIVATVFVLVLVLAQCWA
tara:strand:- start:506 stop:634 length:129 start_codon:yes stop_codon:yes gene_type:complete